MVSSIILIDYWRKIMYIYISYRTHMTWGVRQDTINYYMTSSASGQRWIKFCFVIGYPSGQARVCNLACNRMQSCPLETTHRVPYEKFPRKPYNRSFIDQACSAKMAGYWTDWPFYANLWKNNQKKSLTSERSELVRYCSYHSNIKLISSHHRVISSLSVQHNSLGRKATNTAA